MTTESNGPDRRRARVRTASYSMLLGLVASLGTVVSGAAPAQASGITCPNIDKSDWVAVAASKPGYMWQGFVYSLQSSAGVFDVSDARTVDNTLDSPVTASFTSQQSRTFTLTVTAGRTLTLSKFLTATLNVSITESRTTTLGVTATATVPPHSRVNGLYGIEAYDVTYGTHEYRHVGSKPPTPGDRSCIDYGTVNGNVTNAPTNIEGWRLVAG